MIFGQLFKGICVIRKRHGAAPFSEWIYTVSLTGRQLFEPGELTGIIKQINARTKASKSATIEKNYD